MHCINILYSDELANVYDNILWKFWPKDLRLWLPMIMAKKGDVFNFFYYCLNDN